MVTPWTDRDEAACHGRSLVTADRRKLKFYHGNEPELYDLNTDPGEFRNIARAHPDRVRRAADDLQAWQQTHHDTLTLRV